MALFQSMYERCLALAKHRLATFWLAIVSFTEAIFFPIPPDVLLAPMVLARRARAWFYAMVCTVASAAGGFCGYLLGKFAIDSLMPLIERFGYVETLQRAEASFAEWGFWFILLAGFSPIPYKVFTIAAGMTATPLLPFIFGSIVGRSARYFLVAGLIYMGGEDMQEKLHRRMEWIGWGTVIVFVIAGIVLYLR